MSLRAKIEHPTEPVILYEVIPPRLDVPGDLEDRLELVREVACRADAINIPEIREEKRNGPRSEPLKDRMEPREFARAITAAVKIETVVNRVTVHAAPQEQRQWLHETCHGHGIHDLILVGGESNHERYPGPSVVQAAGWVAEDGLPYLLGGITIPHRRGEAERVRAKARRGLQFFTTQVLLDSKDIARLLRELDGLTARIILSFTPVSHPRDLKFLEWLGVELPAAFEQEIHRAGTAREAEECSLALARRILTDAFEHLPAHAPALGIQVERITKRNSAAAKRMVAELGDFYRRLMQPRYGATAMGADNPARLPARNR